MCLVCLPASQCLCALVPEHDATAIQHAHEHTSRLDSFNVRVNQQHNAAEERTAFLRHPADTVLTKQAKPGWFRAAQD